MVAFEKGTPFAKTAIGACLSDLSSKVIIYMILMILDNLVLRFDQYIRPKLLNIQQYITLHLPKLLRFGSKVMFPV
jgi:hypothetical protein